MSLIILLASMSVEQRWQLSQSLVDYYISSVTILSLQLVNLDVYRFCSPRQFCSPFSSKRERDIKGWVYTGGKENRASWQHLSQLLSAVCRTEGKKKERKTEKQRGNLCTRHCTACTSDLFSVQLSKGSDYCSSKEMSRSL